jgi:uncharacterized Zn-finger protein
MLFKEVQTVLHIGHLYDITSPVCILMCLANTDLLTNVLLQTSQISVFSSLCIGLKMHSERHIRVTSHTCYLCNEGFTRYIDLQKHVRKHNGEASFQCDMCEVKFNSELELDVHVNTYEDSNMSFGMHLQTCS